MASELYVKALMEGNYTEFFVLNVTEQQIKDIVSDERYRDDIFTRVAKIIRERSNLPSDTHIALDVAKPGTASHDFIRDRIKDLKRRAEMTVIDLSGGC